jgi:hypothetical protein
MADLIFENPPDNPPPKRHGRKSRWEDKLIALKAHPGRWVRLNPEPFESHSSATAISASVRWNRYSFMLPDDDYDAEVRNVTDLDNPRWNVYVRYNGVRK